jgi:RNA polymerase sigma factor (sigma-70 family)
VVTTRYSVLQKFHHKLYKNTELVCCNLTLNKSVIASVITIEEEHKLIDRILAGEERCYAELVDQYKSYAFTIALRIVNDRAEAEEVAQDSFVKAFNYLKNFNRQARFSTWLYRIVFNTAISHKRKNRLITERIENKQVENPERADSGIERDDKTLFIGQALKKLNDADQLAIQLFYIKEFSLEEVASLMGQNVNTIKVRIHRARQRLADELKMLLKKEALTL